MCGLDVSVQSIVVPMCYGSMRNGLRMNDVFLIYL